MKATVFRDEALREQAGRFVWLEIDTDKAQNAAFRQQYPTPALPTYLVVEPDREQVVLRWVGGATVPQMLGLLDDAEANFRLVRSGATVAGGDAAPGADDARSPGPANPAVLLAEADLLYGQEKNTEAAAKYHAAIDAAPDDWPDYGRAAEALLVSWSLADEADSAAHFARKVYPRLAHTTSVAVVAGVGLDSALQLPDADPEKAELVAFFEDAARKAAGDRTIPIPADDRSGLYISLLSAREAAGDSAGTAAAVREWSTFLDDAAAHASTPEARTALDSHRLSAYLELGQPEKAIPMLEQSEREFPDDYNPPARLALAYRAMKRWDDALAACDRAIALAYGPRQLRYLDTRASIQAAMGDSAAARATLEDAVRRAEALPAGQRSQRTIDALQRKLAALPG